MSWRFSIDDFCTCAWVYHKIFEESWHDSSLVAQTVKRLTATQETQVWSLGREDPLEKGMATHSSVLAWRIPWTEEPGRLQSMRLQRIRYNLATKQQQIRSTRSLCKYFSLCLAISLEYIPRSRIAKLKGRVKYCLRHNILTHLPSWMT